MKKQTKIIILTAVLLCIILIYAAVVLIGKLTERSDESTQTTYTVAKVDKNSLEEFSYTYGDANYTFHKLGDVWRLDANPNLDFKSQITDAMISSFSPLEALVSLGSVSDEKYSEYGLQTPEITVSFTDKNGKKTYFIGKRNSFNDCYYFCEQNNRDVYMISSVVPVYFRYELSEMVNGESIAEFSLSGVKNVTFTLPSAEGGTHSYVYIHYPAGNDNDYTDAFSLYLSADGDEPFAVEPLYADRFCAALGSLVLDDPVSFVGDVTAYGIDSSRTMSVSYTTEEGDDRIFTLLFGDTADGGGIYVSVEGSGIVYLFDSPIIEKFAFADADDMRLTAITSINERLINSVTFSSGDSELTVDIRSSENGITYFCGGEAIDYLKVQDLFNLLITTPVSSFTHLSQSDSTKSNTPILTVSFDFKQGSSENDTLTVTPYSQALDLVSFRGDEVLITKSSTNALLSAISDASKALGK